MKLTLHSYTSKVMIFVFLLSSAILAAGGNKEASSEERRFSSSEPLRVFVSVLPQRYFAERIGGSRTEVTVLVEPGRDPHIYDPRPRQITALSKGDLFFTIGMPFEKQLIPRIRQINPGMKIVNTLEEVDLIYGEAHYHYDEDGTPYLHDADEPDPHVWLGLQEVRKQIKSIFQAFVELDPEGKNLYEKAFSDFDNEIIEMDLYFKEILTPFKGKSILAFHPAFAYFTSSYGITQKAIELDGKEPSPRHLEKMIDEAIQEGTEVVFTQPEFPERSARLIANAIGGRVVTLNTLDPDWPKLMKTIAEAIAEGVY